MADSGECLYVFAEHRGLHYSIFPEYDGRWTCPVNVDKGWMHIAGNTPHEVLRFASKIRSGRRRFTAFIDIHEPYNYVT